jgi:biopolymer transport protein ExbD
MMTEPGLDAVQRSRIRRASQARELSPDDEGGELNVVPFLDVIVNVMIFVLATIAITFTASFELRPPAAGIRPASGEGLNLTVLVVSDGFAVKASGGNVAPGCAAPGPGIAVPKRGDAYDFAALGECVAALKHATPEGRAESQIFVTANQATDYQTLVRVMDAVRQTPRGEPLFPDVSLRVPR